MGVRLPNTNRFPIEIPNATTTTDGAMSAADKIKLDDDDRRDDTCA